MFKIGNHIVVTVSAGSVLWDWNGCEGEIIEIEEDTKGNKLYMVKIESDNIFVFDYEMHLKGEI